MAQQDKKRESEPRTYYGFRYSDVRFAVMRGIQSLLQDIEEMKDDLLQASGTEYIDYSTGWDNIAGTWEDPNEEMAAALEVIRQLAGFLMQCSPPILEPHEPPFLLPNQLRNDYAQEWFDNLIATGGDNWIKESERQIAEFLAEWDAKNDSSDK